MAPPRDCSSDMLLVLDTTETVVINSPPEVEHDSGPTQVKFTLGPGLLRPDISPQRPAWGLKSPRTQFEPHVST